MKTIILRTDDIHRGNLILVNQEHSYQEQHVVLCTVGTWEGADILYERTAAAALNKLIQEIGGAGQIVPVSAWRSLAEQQKIWEDSLAEHGLEFTQSYVAVPGHSEHQTGLAIDLGIYKEKIDFICPDFPYTGICNKFRKAAPSYGFIERYQKDKEEITGISHEPWHFRYVGYPHSRIITDNNFAFEEYIEFIKDYTENSRLVYKDKSGTIIQIYYVPAEDQTVINLPDRCTCQISGNNTDGFIVTAWRKN